MEDRLSGPLGRLLSDFKALGRLIRAYVEGDYRKIPLDSLILVVAAVVYVVTPVDAIPDFIPGVGYLDDAVVVGFVVKFLRDELAAFKAWEADGSPRGGSKTRS
ncbi:MAG: DUF1232 domain-containing protein [Actinobacteria bacterium]|nr:DUF1232 domain-containing protein [Actinomycetota bacterium]